MKIPFVGPSYNLDTFEASVQRTINLEPIPQEPGNERTTWVFKDVPGLVLIQDFAAAAEEQVFSIQLSSYTTSATFNGGFNSTWENANVLTTATFADWNSGTGRIEILQSGVYQVTFSCQFEATTFANYDTAIGSAPYALSGSSVYPDDFGVSMHKFKPNSLGNQMMQISDEWIILVPTTDTFLPALYGRASNTAETYKSSITVVVRRLGNAGGGV